MRKLKVLIGGADSTFCQARKALLEYWGFEESRHLMEKRRVPN